MKAIILAAGKGARLGKYTQNLPKGMLNFNGKTLIERQVDTLRECGITEVIIVTGYMGDKIKIPNVKYYNNPDYENTNMVTTLFCAEKEMDDEILVCYSDIVYEKNVIKQILNFKADIGVTVDSDYMDYWQSRLDNWKEDLESLQINSQGEIFELGTKTKDLEKTKVRYVGMIKFSKKGIQTLKDIFHENRKKYWDSDEKWLNSKSFKKAYMTDILQAIINAGYKVDPIIIKRGWMEFDTEEDYEKAIKWTQDKSISKYINLEGKMKRIAISQRVIHAEVGADRDGLEQDYIQYYSKLGLILIPIPNVLDNIERYLSELEIDGVILSGGNDINPQLYGELPKSKEIYANERDNTEKKILDFAIAKKIPVLCECRGMQFLNIYFGGKLITNLKTNYNNTVEHIAKTHEIEIIDKKIIQKLGRNKATINSYHAHGFSEREISKELRVLAKSSDGVVEGVKHKDFPIIGIMWHPERPGCDEDLNKELIKLFFWD